MRSQYLLLLHVCHTSSVSARLIPTLEIRDPTWPDDKTATPPAPTSPAQILEQNVACQIISQGLSVCASATPSFTALLPAAQARCLCYSRTVWEPDLFDNAVESCANYASSAAPQAYNALSNLENFCENVGDVNAATSVSNYIPPSSKSSPAVTGYGGAGATSTASTGGSSGLVTSSKTVSGLTVTVGGSAATNTGKASVARRVIPEADIVWIGFGIALLFFFL